VKKISGYSIVKIGSPKRSKRAFKFIYLLLNAAGGRADKGAAFKRKQVVWKELMPQIQSERKFYKFSFENKLNAL
jgi:hypothetical protein